MRRKVKLALCVGAIMLGVSGCGNGSSTNNSVGENSSTAEAYEIDVSALAEATKGDNILSQYTSVNAVGEMYDVANGKVLSTKEVYLSKAGNGGYVYYLVANDGSEDLYNPNGLYTLDAKGEELYFDVNTQEYKNCTDLEVPEAVENIVSSDYTSTFMLKSTTVVKGSKFEDGAIMYADTVKYPTPETLASFVADGMGSKISDNTIEHDLKFIDSSLVIGEMQNYANIEDKRTLVSSVKYSFGEDVKLSDKMEALVEKSY